MQSEGLSQGTLAGLADSLIQSAICALLHVPPLTYSSGLFFTQVKAGQRVSYRILENDISNNHSYCTIRIHSVLRKITFVNMDLTARRG